METPNSKKGVKVKQNNVSTVSLRVKRETKRRIQAELVKVNKKEFGKKVRSDELIMRAIALLGDADIAALQDASFSNADRLEQQYRNYVRTHAGVSKDEFLGTLLASGMRPNS